MPFGSFSFCFTFSVFNFTFLPNYTSLFQPQLYEGTKPHSVFSWQNSVSLALLHSAIHIFLISMMGKIHFSALIILYAYEMLCLTNSKNIFQRLKIYLTSVNHKRCYLCSRIKILIKIHPRMCNPAL